MRRLLYLSIFGTITAMAQVSGPIVTMPAEMGASPTLERVARDGQTSAFIVREF